MPVVPFSKTIADIPEDLKPSKSHLLMAKAIEDEKLKEKPKSNAQLR